jgi:hypothetical protein
MASITISSDSQIALASVRTESHRLRTLAHLTANAQARKSGAIRSDDERFNQHGEHPWQTST